MTRDDILKAVLAMKANNILFEGCTGLGKTKIGLKKALSLTNPKEKILVIVPKLVLIDTWKDEIKKWGLNVTRFEFMCYASFIRKSGEYEVIIGDEAHHMTDAVLTALDEQYVYKHIIMLSATVPPSVKFRIKEHIDYETFTVPLIDAVDMNIVPEPEYWLLEMNLMAVSGMFEIVKNPKKKGEFHLPFKQRFLASKHPNEKVVISCTAQEKYGYIQGMIDFFERKGNNTMKKIYCMERLKCLADFKTKLANSIISVIEQHTDEKIITFCSDIAQTEKIGGNYYHSKLKKKEKEQRLRVFNEGKMKNISACGTLDEGVNLNSCRFGLFLYITASDTKALQRQGRCLRHQKPIIILPYFKDTREEELVRRMVSGMNNIKEIKPKDFLNELIKIK